MDTLYTKLEKALKTEPRFVDADGDLFKNEIIDKAYKADQKLIEILISDKELEQKFFSKIKNHSIFNINDFVAFVQDKNFLNDSYTKFKNKIGLNIDGKFLNERKEVALVWPFKDCVLEGGMTKEDQKRKEIFFNEILAHDDIDKLFAPKVLTNWKRYTKNGEEAVKELKRDSDGTIRENLIIKGNNLVVLHTLKTQFQGKVKLIYIDPPYNTGSDSFGYNDNFNHSTWLTFMKNRLEVAKELLRDDGVIFVQCDDNEQAYIKVLMDEVFGRLNFVSNIITRSTPNARDYGLIAQQHEIVLFYAKRIELASTSLIEVIDKEFNYKDDTGDFNIHPLYNSNVNFHIENRKNLYYPFYLNPEKRDENGFFEISLDSKKDWIEIYPPKSQKEKIQFVWRWGKDKSIENLNLEIVGYQTRDGEYKIVQKMRTSEQLARSIWMETEISNRRATEDLQKLFSKKIFAFPKSENLIKKIIHISTKKDDIVLDYHLGSGTTAAVAHKMNRQYIGIEQMGYVEDISVERLKKVIEGEHGGISKDVNWKGGGDFVYCELMKYNEDFVDQIESAKDTKALLKIWEQMKEKAFFKYSVDLKEFDASIEEFKKIDLDKQKEILVSLLNKNQMYVNLSEIEDKEFKVEKSDKELNKKFYERTT